MQKVDDDIMRALADRALESPHGVEIITTVPEIFKRKFYAFRKRNSNGVDYSTIKVITPHKEADKSVWLVKQE